MATVAAFFKSAVLAIRHNLFIDNYLHKIFTCYKMATWPLIQRHFETEKLRSHLLSFSVSKCLLSRLQQSLPLLNYLNRSMIITMISMNMM
jgi:hypothetical protein